MSNEPLVSTFSIVAISPDTGEVGVAVASKFFAVGAVVTWATANVGAVATQATTNMSQGPAGLELMSQGRSAVEALEILTDGDEELDQRQLGLVDASGGSASWTGDMCLPWAGNVTGKGFTCQGNILSGPEVVDAMVESFQRSQEQFPERMLSVLEAGEAAGGDSRGKQSAALYIAKEGGSYGGHLDRYVDLRVDDHQEPLTEMRRLLELHRLTRGSGGTPTLLRPSGNVANEVQRILKKLGHYAGEITGEYDSDTQAAFELFCQIENFEERLAVANQRGPEWIDREILNFMRRQYG